MEREKWFYYADSNGDDLQMIIREIKDEVFYPLAYVGSKLGFSSSSLIFRKILSLMKIDYIPVADGYDQSLTTDNFKQGIQNYKLNIQELGDRMWGVADDFLSEIDAIPISQYTSKQLLRKAIKQALRLKEKFSIRITGPATDAAIDLLANEDLYLTEAIKEIRIMGGSIDVAGNLFTVETNKVADYNIYLDPLAFLHILKIAQKFHLPINMITHDATNQCLITREYYDEYLASDKWISIEGKLMSAYFARIRQVFGDKTFFNDDNDAGLGFYQWDAHTSKLDEVTKFEQVYINVETTPLIPTSGCIYRTDKFNGYPVNLIMAINYDLFKARWKGTFDKIIYKITRDESIENELID